MKAIKYLQVALESIVAHKMRAVLTMLGIIIGVAAVLITVGIGRGASSSITDQIASQGTNLLTITAGDSYSGGLSSGSGSAGTLTLGDAEALTDRSLHSAVTSVAPAYSESAQLVYDSTNSWNTVVGTTTEYVTIRNLTVANGRFLTADDNESQSAVVVLGSTLAEDLFGTEDPLGLTVRINGEPYTVIGVLEESGGNGFNSEDSQAFVPISVAQSRLFGVDRYRGDYTVSTIYAQAAGEDQVDTAKLQIEATLRLRHSLTAGEDNDFSISDQASLLDTASDISSTLTLFLGSIGGISLLVGGIGIMNIMLVSVTERTREIGLRKAIGVHDSDVLLQFLVEALVLCLLGGLIGVGLSYGLAFIFSQIPAMTFSVALQPDVIVLAVGFSLLAGLIFGIYPAMRATQLDPIEALRTD